MWRKLTDSELTKELVDWLTYEIREIGSAWKHQGVAIDITFFIVTDSEKNLGVGFCVNKFEGLVEPVHGTVSFESGLPTRSEITQEIASAVMLNQQWESSGAVPTSAWSIAIKPG